MHKREEKIQKLFKNDKKKVFNQIRYYTFSHDRHLKKQIFNIGKYKRGAKY